MVRMEIFFLQASLAIVKQCVWTFSDNAANEPLYGRSCATSADCPSATGGDRGTCAKAYRAYCPPLCTAESFVPGSVSAYPLSAATVPAQLPYKMNIIILLALFVNMDELRRRYEHCFTIKSILQKPRMHCVQYTCTIQ